MKPFWSKAVVFLACAALFAGCGASALQNARVSLEKAKAAGAETKAPMEYYMAEEYLKQAEKEQMEDGDRSQGKVYSNKSVEYSTQAIQKAGGGAK